MLFRSTTSVAGALTITNGTSPSALMARLLVATAGAPDFSQAPLAGPVDVGVSGDFTLDTTGTTATEGFLAFQWVDGGVTYSAVLPTAVGVSSTGSYSILEPTGSVIRGQVLDSLGQPVPFATVEVMPPAATFAPALRMKGGAALPIVSSALLTATADANGFYAIAWDTTMFSTATITYADTTGTVVGSTSYTLLAPAPGPAPVAARPAFWEELERSLRELVGNGEGRNVVSNARSGLVAVRAMPSVERSPSAKS